MKIIRSNIASIRNNDPEMPRINLSIAREEIDGRNLYCVVNDVWEDTGPRFASAQEAEEAIWLMWGTSGVWDLQYS